MTGYVVSRNKHEVPATLKTNKTAKSIEYHLETEFYITPARTCVANPVTVMGVGCKWYVLRTILSYLT
jgi:hypothetical protein